MRIIATLLLLFISTQPGTIWAQAVVEGASDADTAALKASARALLEGRRFGEAVGALTQALELEPSDAEAHVLVGRAQANLGRLDLAETHYKHALELNATFAPAMTALGKLYLYLRRADEARAYFERSLEADPQEADTYLGLGRLEVRLIEEHKGSLQRAEGLYRKALDLAPKNEQALFDYGVVLSHLGRHEDAARTFTSAVVLNPTINFTLLGQVYQSFEQWPRAAESYRAAVERDPNDVTALYGHAEVSELMGQRRDAVVKYRGVLELEPDHAQAHARLGMLLVGTGLVNYAAQQACGLNRDEAMWHFHQAVRADPSLKLANDSLEFCLREEIEERRWAERVSALKRQLGERPASQRRGKGRAKGGEEAGTEGRRGGLQHLASLAKLKTRSARKLLKSVLQALGIEAPGQRGGELWLNGRPMGRIPVSAVRSPGELMRYVRANTPVVIRNFQDDYAGRDAWTKDALKRKFGHMTVRVSLSQTGRFDGPEEGRLWGLSSSEEVLVRPPALSMRFRDLLDLLDLAQRPNGSAALPETFYLEYLSLSQYLGPEMLNMVRMPKPAEASPLQPLVTNFWMGRGNTTSPLHYDDYENLLCQIRGTKELVLFPPSDIRYLYYVGRAKGLLEYEYPGTFRRTKLVDSHYNVVFGSSVYLDKPDLRRHPLLIHATPYKVTLQEGDVLYLPAFWHHEVTSHPDPEEGLNIAVNYWFRNETAFVEEEEGLRAAARAYAKAARDGEL